MSTSKILDGAVAGTMYAPAVVADTPYYGLDLKRNQGCGFTVVHPGGGLDIDVTVEVSNMSDDECKSYPNVDDWGDYYTPDGMLMTTNLTAAGNTQIELTQLPFARARLRVDVNAGTGDVTIRVNTKPAGGMA